MLAIISIGYEVLSFFGLPPYPDSPWAKTVALAILVAAFARVLYEKEMKIRELSDPQINFSVSYKDTLQRDGDFHAILNRIIVTNNSHITVTDCRLLIESWTFPVIGLSADSPLAIKDEGRGARSASINRGDSKQFDIFITYLEWNTAKPRATIIGSPNCPQIPIEGSYTLVVRLTGREFQARKYRLLFLVSDNFLNITRLDEQVSDTEWSRIQ
jgi:hypothetical protein